MRNRLIPLPLMLSATVMTSCARGPIQVAPAPTLPMPEESRVGPSPSKLLTPSEAYAEVAKLRADLERELPPRLLIRPKDPQEWIARARGQMEASGYSVERPQLLIVVDRNPRVQQMAVILAQPEGEWLVLGGSKVSTGQANRKGYYITPTGVFLHTDAILDYRAEGTFNENHIRGLGVKGMRVWDFGWQWAVKGWRSDGEGGEIRLLMHATDPDYLEQRLGRPASEGCIRIPAAMNKFLDRHGVLDADYERAAQDDPQYRAVLFAGRRMTPLAGRALVVIDTEAG